MFSIISHQIISVQNFPFHRIEGGMDADPLLRRHGPLVNVVDYNGRPAIRSKSGGWTAALFIIGVEIAERFACCGISLNLITYLTGPLRQSTADAAAAVNAWIGASSMLPLLGAFVADSYLGRYRTIVAASIVYVMGLGMLTMSTMLPDFHPPICNNTMDPTTCLPTWFHVGFFYFSLYIVALAQGGHRPCVQAFGADQFDQNDPEEFVSRSSFFNWWYFGMCGAAVISLLTLTYVQDNLGWGLGFGIPCIVMVIALIVFLLGSKIYRFYVLEDKSPFIRIVKALITTERSRRGSDNNHPTTEGVEETCLPMSDQSKFSHDSHSSYLIKEDEDVCSVHQVEEAKGVLRIFPIWATCLIYGVYFAQSTTFFTKQGSTIDRSIGSNFQVPPAALQCFISGTVVLSIPIYDRTLVPIARKFSKMSSGITMLQRIGIGIFFAIINMVVAALVEMKRLKTARDFGLVDLPMIVIPMSLWWLVPQYILFGISDTFTIVGMQEFFYDQMPDALRSLGLALYLSVLGIGSFISSFLVYIIDKATSQAGDSWFSNNLNRGHLDYFYWLLAGLNAIALVIYLYFAQVYVYKKEENIVVEYE